MGSAIARGLIRSGHAVGGFDVRTERRVAFREAGGIDLASAGDMVSHARVVLTLLPSADALAQVAGEIRAAAKGRDRPDGLVLAEMSTLSVDAKLAARELLEEAGIVMLDCPVSGTTIQVADRDIVVYGSGDVEAWERCLPIFESLARGIHYLGEFGIGSKTKLIANLLVAVHIASAAEALVLARRTGLDPEATLAALADGAGGSRMLEVRGPMMVARDFEAGSMSVGLFQKDLRLIQELAASLDCPVPMLATAAHLYAAAVGQGRESQDTSVVLEILEAMAGVSPGSS
jgi:putative dehydrogenase